MRKLIDQKPFQWVLLVVSTVAGLVGVWALGETFYQLIKLILNIPQPDFALLIIAVSTLAFTAIIGTLALVYVVLVKEKRMRWLILGLAVVLPICLEVVHLTFVVVQVMTEYVDMLNSQYY